MEKSQNLPNLKVAATTSKHNYGALLEMERGLKGRDRKERGKFFEPACRLFSRTHPGRKSFRISNSSGAEPSLETRFRSHLSGCKRAGFHFTTNLTSYVISYLKDNSKKKDKTFYVQDEKISPFPRFKPLG